MAPPGFRFRSPTCERRDFCRFQPLITVLSTETSPPAPHTPLTLAQGAAAGAVILLSRAHPEAPSSGCS